MVTGFTGTNLSRPVATFWWIFGVPRFGDTHWSIFYHFLGAFFLPIPSESGRGSGSKRLAWHIVAPCDADLVLEDSLTDFLNQRVRGWRWTQLWSLDPFEWYLSTKCCYWQTESSFLPMENNQLLGSVPDRLAMWVSVAEQSVRGIFPDTAVRLKPGSTLRVYIYIMYNI